MACRYTTSCEFPLVQKEQAIPRYDIGRKFIMIVLEQRYVDYTTANQLAQNLTVQQIKAIQKSNDPYRELQHRANELGITLKSFNMGPFEIIDIQKQAQILLTDISVKVIENQVVEYNGSYALKVKLRLSSTDPRLWESATKSRAELEDLIKETFSGGGKYQVSSIQMARGSVELALLVISSKGGISISLNQLLGYLGSAFGFYAGARVFFNDAKNAVKKLINKIIRFFTKKKSHNKK